MAFLLDPNLAYLFLLGGFFLAMLAIATPGTGFLEVLSVISLLLGGIAVYSLSVNWWAILLLVLSIAPFVYAVQKPKRELFLAISILLLVIGSVFIFPGEDGFGISVSPVLAGVVSTVVAWFLWLAARKAIDATTANLAHNPDGLVGMTGEARTTIHKDGSVQVGNELWSARSEHPIAEGQIVRVVRRDGFVMIVENESNSST